MRVEPQIPHEIDAQTAHAEDVQRVVERAPVKEPATPGEWVRQNLFSGFFNGLLTVVTAVAVAWFGFRVLRWAIVTADWTVVKVNFRLYMIGRFPIEEAWRVWAVVYMVVALAGLSYGVTGLRSSWTLLRIALRAILGGATLVALLYLIDTVLVFALLGAGGTLLWGGVVAGRGLGKRLQRPLLIAWILAFPLAMVVLRAFDGVPPRFWGGFLLNVILAVVGIFASFPIGVLLALGRRSTLPAIRAFCVAFIEIVRGAPLVAWLIFGWLILPLMLPPGMVLPLIIRIMMMFTIFSAAYVAEIVRGGLQGIHFGQYDAAKALALSYPKMMRLVILPQALRSTIPAMVGHFISLFKDTSLVIVIALLDMSRVARRAPQALEFSGRMREALLVAAVIFFVAAFSMSRWSQRLEARLGVGER
jgi:general L-amino acid transport system permease protein